MSTPNTIARTEIAGLLEISLSKLSNVISYTDIVVPEPLGKEGKHLVYDRKVVLAWIATKPLKNITWKQRPPKDPVSQELAGLPIAFLSGAIGVSKTQRHRNQLRKIAARHAPRPTHRITVTSNDDYTGSRDPWAGLV